MATRKKKVDTDWRKQKREHGGSVYEYKGKLYARIQYVDETGKKKDKKVLIKSGKREDARKEFTKLRKKLKEHGEVALDSHNKTFKELATEYKDTYLQPAVIRNGKKEAGLRSYKTPQGFLATLVDYFGKQTIRTIKHSDLERFRLKRLMTDSKYGGERKVASVHRELALLRSLFRYAVRENYLVKSPFESAIGLISKASEVERTRILSYTEEAALLAACGPRAVKYVRKAHKREGHEIAERELTFTDDGKRRQHLRAFIVTALDSGMRRGELLKLEWKDVNLNERVIRILSTNTKTEKERHAGMTPRVVAALTELKAEQPPEYDGLIFGVASIKHAWTSALRVAGISGVRLHDLRHTAITRKVAAGIPHAEIMKETGHSQFSTFLRYVNTSVETARQNAEQLAAYQETQVIQSEAVN